jgi:hypothetical protein
MEMSASTITCLPNSSRQQLLSIRNSKKQKICFSLILEMATYREAQGKEPKPALAMSVMLFAAKDTWQLEQS